MFPPWLVEPNSPVVPQIRLYLPGLGDAPFQEDSEEFKADAKGECPFS